MLSAIVLGGIGLIAWFVTHPPPLTRGAIAGEHWHASLKMYICGKQVTNYPTIEGELHSHADGFIHIHPQTMTNELASLGTFLSTYQTSIAEDAKGKRTLTFPDQTSYADGDRCGKKGDRYDVEVSNKGEPITDDPASFVPHDGDAIEIRFGPEKTSGTRINPYAKANGIPDPGVASAATPAPDGPAPDGSAPDGGEAPEEPADDPEDSPEPDDEATPAPV